MSCRWNAVRQELQEFVDDWAARLDEAELRGESAEVLCYLEGELRIAEQELSDLELGVRTVQSFFGDPV